GAPFRALRRATPLLPARGTLNSRRNSKSPYSFSVISQPPPAPLVKRSPPPAPHRSSLPPSLTLQPLRSLPLNSCSNPSGGPLSAARSPGQQHSRADRGNSSTARRIGRPSARSRGDTLIRPHGRVPCHTKARPGFRAPPADARGLAAD